MANFCGFPGKNIYLQISHFPVYREKSSNSQPESHLLPLQEGDLSEQIRRRFGRYLEELEKCTFLLKITLLWSNVCFTRELVSF